MPLIYLDNAATTKILPEVKEAMLPFLELEYGNPSAKYYELAISAKKAVEEARDKVASLVGVEKAEVVFTSGATESNNFIIKGVAHFYKKKGKHLITSKTEHASVLNTFKYLESDGYTVTYLDVDENGLVNPEDLKVKITDQTILVSIQWVNGELGSINNIDALSDICNNKKVFFHTDATQAIGKIEINLDELSGVNFLSISAHKFHGPKGVGAAIIRHDEDGVPRKLTPLLHGGEHESGYRSGTLAVHNIVGLGKASEICIQAIKDYDNAVRVKEERLIRYLENIFGNKITFRNIHPKVPGIISSVISGMNNQILLKKLSSQFAASSGSVCSFSSPSYVLKSIGCSDHEIRETIRFSVNQYSDI